MANLTRRGVLKLASVTIGALALGSDFNPNFVFSSQAPVVSGNIREIPSVCGMCAWKCGISVRVEDGRVTKIDGHPANPKSLGKLCPRGQAGISTLYDPDRLKTPLISVGERGEGKYRQATWEEALDLSAEKLMQIHDRFGPEALAWFGGNGAGNRWFTSYLPAVLHCPNAGTAAGSLCLSPRDVAADYTFGAGIPSHEPLDWDNTRFVVLIGSHIGENAHNTLIQGFARARSKGAKVVVVDPRFSSAASKADWWLPIKPGTDTALLLAWLNVLINEDLVDHEYLDRYTIGYEQLVEHVQPYTPEWAEGICEIPAADIVQIARELAHESPEAVIFPGRYVVWYGNDTQRMRAAYLVNIVLGSHGRKGGLYMAKSPYLKDFPGAPGGAEGCGGGSVESDTPRADGQGTKFVSGPLAIQEVFETIITEQPYPVKGLVAYGVNLFHSIPKVERTKEALRKLDFYLAIDVYPQEHVMWADVILPECTYLERYDDLVTVSHKTPFISMRQPVVEPMWESKPGWWIARELGVRMGLRDSFAWSNIEEYLEYRLKSVRSSLEEMKEQGLIVQNGKPYLDEDYDMESNSPFLTPSGRIEIYSQRLADAGQDPLPHYEPVDEPPAGFYRLIYGRSPVHSFARTQNNELLSELMPENELWLNTHEALNQGVKHGQYVVLENQDGVRSNEIRIKVTERIRQDCVYMVHGFGINAPGMRRAHGRGADDSGLQTRYNLDPISGGAGLRVNFVKIIKKGDA